MGEIISLHQAAERMGCSVEEVERLVREGRIRMTRDGQGTPLVFAPLPRYSRPRQLSARRLAQRAFWRSPAGIAARVGIYLVTVPIALSTGVDWLLIYTAVWIGLMALLWLVDRPPPDRL